MTNQNDEDDVARSNRLMHEFIERDVKPRSVDICAIAAKGRLPVLIHKPTQLGADAASALGWDGQSAVFAARTGALRTMTANLLSTGDTVSARWMLSGEPHRLFVIWGDGTLLLNWGDGWSLEPRSLDKHVLS